MDIEKHIDFIIETTKAKGITQSDIARQTGISERTIRSVYRRERLPVLTTYFKILECLGISIDIKSDTLQIKEKRKSNQGFTKIGTLNKQSIYIKN